MTISVCSKCKRVFDMTLPGTLFPGGNDEVICPECAPKEPLELKT